MTKPSLSYPPSRIAEIRSWTKDCLTWLEARAVIAAKLGVDADNVTKMHRRHQFWSCPLGTQTLRGTGPTVDIVPRAIRRLFLDIETSPNVVTSWRIGRKIDLIPDNILHERKVICACWSWDGEDKVHFAHWDKGQNDKVIFTPLLKAIAEADEIVYHNGERFDMPWVKTRCLFHGLPTLPDHKGVDTLQWARRKFYFNSNKLDYIARFLGIGSKLKTEFGLWKAIVFDHDADALKRMVTYCQNDVVLLKKVWARLAAVLPHKTHVGVLAGGAAWSCPFDGSTNVRVSKTRVTARGGAQYQMVCADCGRYYSISATAHRAYREAKGV